MHIEIVSVFILSFLTPCLLGAPVYDDSWQALILRRGDKETSHIPASNAASRLLFPTSASVNPTHDDHQASVRPILTGGGAPHPTDKGKRPLVPCSTPKLGSASSSSSTQKSGHDQGGKDIFVHPETEKSDDHPIIKRVTLGNKIGAGSNGAVYEVANHELKTHRNLVAKSIIGKHTAAAEINALSKVGQLHGSGICDEHIWAVLEKKPGVYLADTKTFEDAFLSGPQAAEDVKKHAVKLAGQERFNMADKHGVLHNDVHDENVLFEETDGEPGSRKLVKAHLVDWGRTEDAPPKDPNTGQYTPEQKETISNIPIWQWPAVE